MGNTTQKTKRSNGLLNTKEKGKGSHQSPQRKNKNVSGGHASKISLAGMLPKETNLSKLEKYLENPQWTYGLKVADGDFIVPLSQNKRYCAEQDKKLSIFQKALESLQDNRNAWKDGRIIYKKGDTQFYIEGGITEHAFYVPLTSENVEQLKEDFSACPELLFLEPLEPKPHQWQRKKAPQTQQCLLSTHDVTVAEDNTDPAPCTADDTVDAIPDVDTDGQDETKTEAYTDDAVDIEPIPADTCELASGDAVEQAKNDSFTHTLERSPTNERLREMFKAQQNEMQKQQEEVPVVEEVPESEPIKEMSTERVQEKAAEKTGGLKLTRCKVEDDGSDMALIASIVCDEAAAELAELHRKDKSLIKKMFEVSYHQKIAPWIIAHHNKYKKSPHASIQDIFNEKKKYITDEAEIDNLENFFDNLNTDYINNETRTSNKEYLLDELRKFCKKRILSEAMVDAKNLMETGQLHEAQKVMNDALLLTENQTSETIETAFNEAINYKISNILWKHEPPHIDYFFEGNMPERIVAAIVGDGGSGKSTLMLQLAISVASSLHSIEDIFPSPPQGKAFFFSGEDSRELVDRRMWYTFQHCIQGQESHKEAILKQLDENLIIMPAGAYPMKLIEMEHCKTYETAAANMLRKDLKKISNLKMVVLDTFSKLSNGDGNANQLADAFIHFSQKIAHETGATVFVIHHISKASANATKTQLAQGAARGSSGLTNSVRWQSNLASIDDATAKTLGLETTQGYVLLGNSKNNYAAKAETKLLRFENGILRFVRNVDLHSTKETKYVDDDIAKHVIEYIESNNTTKNALKKTVSPNFEPNQASIVVEQLIKDKKLHEVEELNLKNQRTKYLRMIEQ